MTTTTCTTRGARVAASIGYHGLYAIYADDLDRMMDLHLPASPATLRAKLHEASGYPTYQDVTSVTELLMILAEYEGRSADLRDSREVERLAAGQCSLAPPVEADPDVAERRRLGHYTVNPTEEQINDWNIANDHQDRGEEEA